MNFIKFFTLKNCLIIAAALLIVVTSVVVTVLVVNQDDVRDEERGGFSKSEKAEEVQEIIEESEELFEDGRFQEALSVLYENKGKSKKIQNQIDEFMGLLTLECTATPDECDASHCFEDTTHPDSSGCDRMDVGLQLVESHSGKKETVARITMNFEEGFHPEDDTLKMVGNKGDTWVFYGYSGPGKPSAFMYTVHSNKLKTFKPSLTIWDTFDELVIGQTFAYAAGEPTDLYAYTWDGELLYSKKEMCGTATVYEGKVYYILSTFANEKETYKIYKMNPDGSDPKQLCFIEAPFGAYAALSEDEVVWYADGEQKSMKLSKLTNVYWEAPQQKPSSNPNTSDPTVTNPTTTVKTPAMVLTITWTEQEPEFDFVVTTQKVSTWNGNNLYRSDGTLIATKQKSSGKQIVNIYDINDVYNVMVDDLNYGYHLMNYMSGADFSVKKNGIEIANDIGAYMKRSYTGFWYAEFTIDNGNIR